MTLIGIDPDTGLGGLQIWVPLLNTDEERPEADGAPAAGKRASL